MCRREGIRQGIRVTHFCKLLKGAQAHTHRLPVNVGDNLHGDIVHLHSFTINIAMAQELPPQSLVVHVIVWVFFGAEGTKEAADPSLRQVLILACSELDVGRVRLIDASAMHDSMQLHPATALQLHKQEVRLKHRGEGPLRVPILQSVVAELPSDLLL